MHFGPSERFLFGVEEPVDDDGITLGRVPSTQPRSFAIDHVRPAIDG